MTPPELDVLAPQPTERRLLEGSEAIAEAMVAAGCRFFAGYPMTPFTEVLEHMARLLPAVGGTCINAESELEAVGMAWGAAATGCRSATGSVGQGLSLMQESLSELCYARVPLVVLNMARGQGDYFQATRGGGHGDYRHIVLSPSDIPEAIELVQLAFHLADHWRNPVLFLGDYYLAHVLQGVAVAPIDFGPTPPKDWALRGRTGGTGKALAVTFAAGKEHIADSGGGYGAHLERMAEHINAMAEQVTPMVETAHLEDAELVVVSYGTAARYMRHVVSELRAEGLPVGFIRPITLWPFPTEVIAAAAEGARAVAVYELNNGQMVDDVRLAVLGRAPVHFIGRVSTDDYGFGIAPDLDVEFLTQRVRDTLAVVRRQQ
jgi:2-oxoglutarate ferredoxin oxidoreductase subunit alpha